MKHTINFQGFDLSLEISEIGDHHYKTKIVLYDKIEKKYRRGHIKTGHYLDLDQFVEKDHYAMLYYFMNDNKYLTPRKRVFRDDVDQVNNFLKKQFPDQKAWEELREFHNNQKKKTVFLLNNEESREIKTFANIELAYKHMFKYRAFFGEKFPTLKEMKDKEKAFHENDKLFIDFWKHALDRTQSIILKEVLFIK